MKVKRGLILMITILLVLSLVTVASAKQPENVRMKLQQKFQTKFKDIKGHWAAGVIERIQAKGLVSGYEDETFRPNNEVTNAEALVMVVRTLKNGQGIDGDILEDEDITRIKHYKQLAKYSWALPEIAYALQQGLIQDSELKKFIPNKPAKRIDVARYIYRALDVDDEIDIGDYKEQLPKDLFEDLDELDSVDLGIIQRLVNMGIFKGNGNGTLQPNKPVTRAEISALLGRVLDVGDDGDVEEETTISSDLEEAVAGEETEFTVATTASEEDEGKDVRVKITLLNENNEDNVELYYEEDGDYYELEFDDVDEVAWFGPEEGFDLGNVESEFKVTFAEAKTYEYKMEIVDVDADEVLASTVEEVEVMEAEEEELQGIIIVVDGTGTQHITIDTDVEDEDEGETRYKVSNEVDLDDIHKGYEVILELDEDDVVTDIDIVYIDYEGTVTIDDSEVYIEVEDGDEMGPFTIGSETDEIITITEGLYKVKVTGTVIVEVKKLQEVVAAVVVWLEEDGDNLQFLTENEGDYEVDPDNVEWDFNDFEGLDIEDILYYSVELTLEGSTVVAVKVEGNVLKGEFDEWLKDDGDIYGISINIDDYDNPFELDLDSKVEVSINVDGYTAWSNDGIDEDFSEGLIDNANRLDDKNIELTIENGEVIKLEISEEDKGLTS